MEFGDLRAILHYVPQFRGSTFVVALDGAVVDSPEFSNILLDLAALRSLDIGVVLVHGAAAQIEALAAKRGAALSSSDGIGPTDEATLELSMDAISRLGNSVMQSLTSARIQAATANAVHAHPAGIIGGEDQGATGTIDRVDSRVLRSFLDQGILPVVPPLAFDSDGQTLRVNSDVVAREVSVALGADKLLFVSWESPASRAPELERQIPCDEAERFTQDAKQSLPPGLRSKFRNACRAIREGVPRVHLVGSDQEDALLAELFSNEGVGIMVFADAYQKLRPATPADVDELRLLIHRAVEDDQLLDRSREELLADVDDFLILEIDGNVVGCVAVHPYPDDNLAEMACLHVKHGHNGQGYGKTLVQAALDRVKKLGYPKLFALSTQAIGYLESAGFQRDDDLARLPDSRRQQRDASGRNAVLLIREI